MRAVTGYGWEGEITKKRGMGTSGVHYIDCGDDFIDVNICQNVSNCILQRSMW